MLVVTYCYMRLQRVTVMPHTVTDASTGSLGSCRFRAQGTIRGFTIWSPSCSRTTSGRAAFWRTTHLWTAHRPSLYAPCCTNTASPRPSRPARQVFTPCTCTYAYVHTLGSCGYTRYTLAAPHSNSHDGRDTPSAHNLCNHLLRLGRRASIGIAAASATTSTPRAGARCGPCSSSRVGLEESYRGHTVA